MRVSRIELKQVGPFEDAVVEIPPPVGGQRGELVLFEGPNGCGKTTIAQAIACAAAKPPRIEGVQGQLWSEWRQDPLTAAQRYSFALAPPLGSMTRRLDVDGHLELQIQGADGVFMTWLGPLGIRWPERADCDAAMQIQRCAEAALGDPSPLRWAAFAYRGHLQTPEISTRGVAEIDVPPLRGALSFGSFEPASVYFGQLLTNLNYERATAFMEAHKKGLPRERRDELQRIANARGDTLAKLEEALSELLARRVRFDFPFDAYEPEVLFDDEPFELDLLGEGMRSTLAWLADLLVRLHRIEWEGKDISPFDQDFWLILDEIDESLHPTMQMRIIPMLRRLFPNARLYVTTHSPFVVASAGEGYVFTLRPDDRHRVLGHVEARKLEPGQSLEWVVEEIFEAETGFIDAWTRDALAAHRADIHRLRRKEQLAEEDWRVFLDRRAALMRLNEQVQTVVAMQEVPVQRAITARLAAAHRDADGAEA